MKSIGTLELRQKLAEHLDLVAQGEAFLVTRARGGRGEQKPAALLVPPTWSRPIAPQSDEPPTLTLRSGPAGVSLTLSGTVRLTAGAGSDAEREALIAGLRMLAGPAGIAVVRMPEGEGFVETAGILRVEVSDE